MRHPAPTLHFDTIDILRGLSVLAVVLLHTAIRMDFLGFSLKADLPRWLYHLLFWNGNNGVTVFFAVSGFLITFTSLRRFGSLAKVRPGAFYQIRAARIAPLLLLVLAVLSLLHLVHAEGFVIPPERTTLPRALFAALTLHLNWLEAVRGYLPANWDVLWSLSVEEMFYLFFPLACFVLPRLRRGTALFVALLSLFVVAGPFARTMWTAGNEIWREKSYLGGMDGIALGCLTALLADRLSRTSPRRSLLAMQVAGAALMLLIALWPRWSWLGSIGRRGLDGTLLALGTCLVILSTVLGGKAGSRWTAPIRWLGRCSYEVYLTHEFVVVWATGLYVKSHCGPLALWFLGIVLVSAGVGAMVAGGFSEPLNRKLRAYFNPALASIARN